MVKTMAPDIPSWRGPTGYPSKNERLSPAWQDIWSALLKARRRVDPMIEGIELAKEIAPKYDLQPVTLTGMMSRAAQADILERESRWVDGARGPRKRTFYRIREVPSE